MWIDQAHEEADALERHPCLRVEIIANGLGLLRELRAPEPWLCIPAMSWLLVVRHQGERAVTLYGGPGDERLLDAVFDAMSRHALSGLSNGCHGETVDAPESYSPAWRCPIHEILDAVAPSQVTLSATAAATHNSEVRI